MAHEISVDMIQVTTKHDLLDYVKVMRLYGGDDQKMSEAFRTAVHELVKGVKPTKADIKAVETLRKANLAKRYEKRMTDARYRGEFTVDALDKDGRSGKRGRKPIIPGVTVRDPRRKK